MIFLLSLLLVLDVHKVGASTLTSSEAVSEDDKMLLDCLEHVSYAKVFIWSVVLD
jgi:hypothetical protein